VSSPIVTFRGWALASVIDWEICGVV